jgi:hypothetical protein
VLAFISFILNCIFWRKLINPSLEENLRKAAFSVNA